MLETRALTHGDSFFHARGSHGDTPDPVSSRVAVDFALHPQMRATGGIDDVPDHSEKRDYRCPQGIAVDIALKDEDPTNGSGMHESFWRAVEHLHQKRDRKDVASF